MSSASYPNAIPSFTTKQDQIDINYAAHINRLQDEVRAIANELGNDPRGNHETVRHRLENLAANKSDINHNHDARYWRRTLITSKGQILAGTGSENLAAVQPGANNRVFLSDDSTPTGVAWRQLTHSLFGDIGGDHYEQYALADGTRGAFLPLAGGTMQGPAVLDGYREKIVTIPGSGASRIIDAALGTAFKHTMTQATHFELRDTSGLAGAVGVTVEFTQDASAPHEYTWENVRWLGSGPPAPTGANTKALASFFSTDGGATWLGVALIEY